MNATTKIALEMQALKARLAMLEEKLNADKTRLVRIAKASEITGLTKAALRQRVQRGQLPCTKDETGHLIFSIEHLNKIAL